MAASRGPEVCKARCTPLPLGSCLSAQQLFYPDFSNTSTCLDAALTTKSLEVDYQCMLKLRYPSCLRSSAVDDASNTNDRWSLCGLLWTLCAATRTSWCCPHSLVSCDSFIQMQAPAGPVGHGARLSPAPPPLSAASAPPAAAQRTCSLPSPPQHPSSRITATLQRAYRCFRRSALPRPPSSGRSPRTALRLPVSSITDNCTAVVSIRRALWKNDCNTSSRVCSPDRVIPTAPQVSRMCPLHRSTEANGEG
jgi:hypothetical protein